MSTALRWADQAEVAWCVTTPQGAVLDLYRTRRIASPSQTVALIARDGGCSFPGCDVGPSWCERHHIVAWQDGGDTNLDNLTLVCRYHHRHFETGGWTCRTQRRSVAGVDPTKMGRPTTTTDPAPPDHPEPLEPARPAGPLSHPGPWESQTKITSDHDHQLDHDHEADRRRTPLRRPSACLVPAADPAVGVGSSNPATDSAGTGRWWGAVSSCRRPAPRAGPGPPTPRRPGPR